MRIRTFEERDRAAVVDLWRRGGLTRPWNDPDRDIERKLADSPWGLLVAVEEEQVIAVAMVGYDGHRGSVNYLAVDPDRRGRGVGGAVMARAEQLLADRGCPKINLQVRSENADVITFYQQRGYATFPGPDVVNLGLRLIPDRPAAG